MLRPRLGGIVRSRTLLALRELGRRAQCLTPIGGANPSGQQKPDTECLRTPRREKIQLAPAGRPAASRGRLAGSIGRVPGAGDRAAGGAAQVRTQFFQG